MKTELNNITILITILGIVSIVGLILNNEMIVTTVIGGLIGYLSKDVNINLEKTEKENKTPYTVEYTNNTSQLGYRESLEEKTTDNIGEGDDTA